MIRVICDTCKEEAVKPYIISLDRGKSHSWGVCLGNVIKCALAKSNFVVTVENYKP